MGIGPTFGFGGGLMTGPEATGGWSRGTDDIMVGWGPLSFPTEGPDEESEVGGGTGRPVVIVAARFWRWACTTGEFKNSAER